MQNYYESIPDFQNSVEGGKYFNVPAGVREGFTIEQLKDRQFNAILHKPSSLFNLPLLPSSETYYNIKKRHIIAMTHAFQLCGQPETLTSQVDKL